jgi:hypothetical protein
MRRFEAFYYLDKDIMPDEKVNVGPQLLPYKESQVSQES